MKPLLGFLAAFGVTFVLLPKLTHIAASIGLIDHPGKRKVHNRPKPLVGGIGMMIGISISLLLFTPLVNLRGFYAGMLALAIVGFLDDFRELDHWWKFYVQVFASACVIVFSGATLHTFGDLLSLGPIDFPVLSLPMTVFCIVGVVNAVNMIDGLDGLAGGISFIAFASFAVLSYIGNYPNLVLLSVAFCGALLAFLWYNWHPSKLFMGDAGSLTLGFALAFLSIAVTQRQGSPVPPVASLLIMAVPITDTVTVMLKRALSGKSPFHADKSHLHHMLLRMGFSKREAVLIMYLISFVFSITAVGGTILNLPEHSLFFVFVVYFTVYFAASFHVRKIIRAVGVFRRRLAHDVGLSPAGAVRRD